MLSSTYRHQREWIRDASEVRYIVVVDVSPLTALLVYTCIIVITPLWHPSTVLCLHPSLVDPEHPESTS